MDVFYIGFNLDMTKEFIDTCADWSKALHYAAAAIEEFLFTELDEAGNTKQIQAFRIKYDSGFSITALTSRPRSLRGRQGYIIIDEAAFHDDLKELMKAALAMLIWGGKVLVISTHDGVNNTFNEYIKDAQAGRNKYKVITITFDDALKEGLYKRICLTTGKTWTEEAEAAWRQEIVDFYGEGADEELFCVPKMSSGTFLPSMLIESRMEDVLVIRLSLEDEFVFKPEYERERYIADWCQLHLLPLLDGLDKSCMHSFGEDFGRSGDLTVAWPLEIGQQMKRRTPFTVELRNVPFAQQRQIVWFIIDRLPRFQAGAFDARGNGQQLAEETMQRYGANIHMLMVTAAWYAETLPKYKAAFEDGLMTIPQDSDVLNDHRLAVIVKGKPQIPETRTKGGDGGKRHGDSLVAGAMAYYASLQDLVAYEYEAAKPPAERPAGRPNHDDDEPGIGRFGGRSGAF